MQLQLIKSTSGAITPNILNTEEGSQTEFRSGGASYIINEWTGKFPIYRDRWVTSQDNNINAGYCTAVIRRFSDNYQEATFTIKHFDTFWSEKPATYFYLGIHDINLSTIDHRTGVFNDREFVIGYLPYNNYYFIHPHISVTTHADATYAWDHNTQSSEQWGVDPNAILDVNKPKAITTRIGTISVTKDLNENTGYMYGLGFYANDSSGSDIIYPKDTITTIKISGRYRYNRY